MRSEIPRPIKINVLRRWLHGKSREEIAKEEGISTGTVSNIIKEYRQDDPEFDQLREVAVMLRSEGYSIECFACLVRIRQILTGLLLTDTTTPAAIRGEGNNSQKQQQELLAEEKIESLVVALEVFGFKQKTINQGFR